MKPHIQMYQLMHLTRKQQNKLKKIADEHFKAMEKLSEIIGDKKSYCSENFFSSRYTQFFNVGKLIELLEENILDEDMEFDILYDPKYNIHEVSLRHCPTEGYVYQVYEDELVDALWKAVCYVSKDGD